MGLLNVNSSISVRPQNISPFSNSEYFSNYQRTAMDQPRNITLCPQTRQPYVNQAETITIYSGDCQGSENHGGLAEQGSLPNINIIEDVTLNTNDDFMKYIKFNTKK